MAKRKLLLPRRLNRYGYLFDGGARLFQLLRGLPYRIAVDQSR